MTTSNVDLNEAKSNVESIKESEGPLRKFDNKKISTEEASNLKQNKDKLPEVSVIEKNGQEEKPSAENDIKQISNMDYEEDKMKASDSICKKDCAK